MAKQRIGLHKKTSFILIAANTTLLLYFIYLKLFNFQHSSCMYKALRQNRLLSDQTAKNTPINNIEQYAKDYFVCIRLYYQKY